MLKDMIKKILIGDKDGGAVDTAPNTVNPRAKGKFYEELKKGLGAKRSGREAILALEENE